MKENSTPNTSAQMLGKALTVLIVLLSFWFIYLQIESSDIDIFETLFNAEPIIFMAIICIFGVLVLSPIIWKFLMLGSGADVPYRLCFGIWWTTNIAKYVPGKVSLIAGRAYVARKYGSKVVLESFVWELIISVSSAVLAGLFLIELGGIASSMKWFLVFVGIVSLFPILSPRLTQDLVRKPFSLLGRGGTSTLRSSSPIGSSTGISGALRAHFWWDCPPSKYRCFLERSCSHELGGWRGLCECPVY